MDFLWIVIFTFCIPLALSLLFLGWMAWLDHKEAIARMQCEKREEYHG